MNYCDQCVTHFEGLRTKLLLMSFYFFTRHFQKRKKSRFLKSDKDVKYVGLFSNIGPNKPCILCGGPDSTLGEKGHFPKNLL